MTENFNKIKKVFNKFSPFEPTNCNIYETKIRFSTVNVDGNLINMSLSVGDLCDDWYGECVSCPENDAIIQSLELSNNRRVEKVKNKLLKSFAFEDMMAIIEEVWP